MSDRAIHRHSLRLPEYDYAEEGAYFVTLCTYKSELIFGEVVDGQVLLNPYGERAYEEWVRTSSVRREVRLDVFQVMPNHLHGIVLLTADTTRSASGPAVGATGPTGTSFGRRSPLQPHESGAVTGLLNCPWPTRFH